MKMIAAAILMILALGCSDLPRKAPPLVRQVSLCGKSVKVKVAPGFPPLEGGGWVGASQGKLAYCGLGRCEPSGWSCPEPEPEPEPVAVYVLGPYREAVALCRRFGSQLSEGERHGDSRLQAVARLQFDGRLAGLGSIHFMSTDRGMVFWANEDGTVGHSARRANIGRALKEAFSWECLALPDQVESLRRAAEARALDKARAAQEAEEAETQAKLEAEAAAEAILAEF